MAFIHKCFKTILYMMVIGFLTAMPLASIALAQDVPGQSKHSNKSCPPSETAPPQETIFQHLTGVNLIVGVSGKYSDAMECHGHEEQCISKAPRYGTAAFDPTPYIKLLKEDYQTYPQALYPETVRALFLKRAEAYILPLVQRDEQCHLPPPRVLAPSNNADLKAIDNAIYHPGALTIIVGIDVIDYTEPHIAILSYRLFRPDCYEAYIHSTEVNSTVIPLNLSNDAITAKLNEFAEIIHNMVPLAPAQY